MVRWGKFVAVAAAAPASLESKTNHSAASDEVVIAWGPAMLTVRK
jgi:hypothetical protein